jgi:SAM-dependent methyltransferase
MPTSDELRVAGHGSSAAVDAKTRELRDAHDVLAELYVERLANVLDEMPIEQALLGLFCQLVREGGNGLDVADVGCGTGRLAPYLSSQGLAPHGVDLSPEMIRVARRDYPDHPFEVSDLRALPFDDSSMAGAVGWYSLMYLPPEERPGAFGELARVVKAGGYFATAFKAGDDQLRRAGRTLDLGIEFDIYWLSPAEMERLVVQAGFQVVFWGGRPADPDEVQAQGYLIAQRQ